MRSDMHTDVAKLIAAFRNVANAPNKTKCKEFTKEIIIFRNLSAILG